MSVMGSGYGPGVSYFSMAFKAGSQSAAALVFWMDVTFYHYLQSFCPELNCLTILPHGVDAIELDLTHLYNLGFKKDSRSVKTYAIHALFLISP